MTIREDYELHTYCNKSYEFFSERVMSVRPNLSKRDGHLKIMCPNVTTQPEFSCLIDV